MNKIKVLIIEDDPMVAEFNKSYVKQIGHPFTVIGSCFTEEQALEIVKTNTPDLILLDIYLPNGNEINLLKTIRKHNFLLDVIIITAAKDSATVQEALRYGAVDFLIKPFGFKRFKQSLLNYSRLKKIIDSEEQIKQIDLDSRFELLEINNNSFLPKGVHLPTLKLINDYLYEQTSPKSCKEISEELSMSRITTWRYLEYLVKEGMVSVSLEYGIGRPTKMYKLK
ncbi:MAG TPA: response regulator [Peptococcaceae bacterium]|nr:response regulator [Peptococcaceae bacterium]